jgi:hypothetical protein
MVGIIGTLVGIVNSFVGSSGSNIAGVIAATFGRFADAYVPAALGLLVGVPSLWLYNYLAGRLECFDREMENATLELVNLLILCPVGSVPTPPVKFVSVSPIFRDEIGNELRDDRRPWYRSSLMVAALLFVTWCVQIPRYFDNYELSLESVILRAGVYVLATFAVFCFAAYPVWLKLLHRASGGLAALASLLCLGWTLTELFFHVHLW